MAARFWVGGSGNWDAATTTHWSGTSNGAGGQSVPASGDTVTFDANSGGGTITLTTSPTITSLTTGAHTGSFVLGAHTLTVSGAINISGAGVRTWNATSATISCATWTATTTTNLTFTNSGSLTMTGSTVFNGGGLSYGTVVLTGATPTVSGANTIGSFTITGTAALTNTVTFTANQTLTTFVCNGNSIINRVLLLSSVVGTSISLSVSAFQLTVTNTDFQDITGTGTNGWGLSAISGGSGDCGGNTGITFTPSSSQTWSGTASGNWSTNAWTTRVPLPQDDVTINSAFSASQTITADMPRLGRSINFTGTTGSPTLSSGSSCSVYGSFILASGMTVSISILTFSGRSTYSITSNGVTLAAFVSVTAPTSSYTFTDDVTISGTFFTVSLQINAGTVSFSGNVNLTNVASAFTMSGDVVNMGSGTWSLGNTSAQTIWNVTGGTVNAQTSTILISTTSANTRTFAGGGATYNILSYIVANSTGQLTITGANTFRTINFSDGTAARSLIFPAATTTTITNLNVFGVSGHLMSINSSTGSSAATISRSSGIVSLDYVSITWSTASGGASWYGGSNSTNGGNNSGWVFTDVPQGFNNPKKRKFINQSVNRSAVF